MIVDRIPVMIIDETGRPKATSIGVAVIDDDGMMIVVFDGVTLKNGESISFTVEAPDLTRDNYTSNKDR